MGKHRIIQPGDAIEHLEIIENLGYKEGRKRKINIKNNLIIAIANSFLYKI